MVMNPRAQFTHFVKEHFHVIESPKGIHTTPEDTWVIRLTNHPTYWQNITIKRGGPRFRGYLVYHGAELIYENPLGRSRPALQHFLLTLK